MFLLVLAHLGFPGQIPQSRKTVVCVCSHVSAYNIVNVLLQNILIADCLII